MTELVCTCLAQELGVLVPPQARYSSDMGLELEAEQAEQGVDWELEEELLVERILGMVLEKCSQQGQ